MAKKYVPKSAGGDGKGNVAKRKQVAGPDGRPMLVDSTDPRPELKKVADIPKLTASVEGAPKTTTVAPAGHTAPVFPPANATAGLPRDLKAGLPEQPKPSDMPTRLTAGVKNAWGNILENKPLFNPAAQAKIEEKAMTAAAKYEQSKEDYIREIGELQLKISLFDTELKNAKAELKRRMQERASQ